METGSINLIKSDTIRQQHAWQYRSTEGSAHVQPLFLQCEVMFGSPSSNCDGNGICKIAARSNNQAGLTQRTSCSHAKALFTSLDNGQGACMIFRREWLCANLMRRHFRHGILEMPEPCPIPQALSSKLGLQIGELPAGLHLIEDFGAHYRINFRSHNLI